MSRPLTHNGSPTTQRQRLAAARQRVHDARDALNEAKRDYAAAKERGDTTAADSALVAAEQASDERDVSRELERQILGQLAGVRDTQGRVEAQETLRVLASTNAPIQTNVHLGDWLSADEVVQLTGKALAASGLPSIPGEARQGAFLGIVDQPQAPLSLLDLFASVPFDGKKADYMVREGGIAAAEIQVEGEVKQVADIDYLPAEAEAHTIASWIKANRQDIDHVDRLSADLSTAPTYGVLVRLERLLVDAVLASTGLGSPDLSGQTNLADRASVMLAYLRLTGVVPNFVAANPLDVAYGRTTPTTWRPLSAPPPSSPATPRPASCSSTTRATRRSCSAARPQSATRAMRCSGWSSRTVTCGA